MDLKAFVKSILVDIDAAVEEARRETKRDVWIDKNHRGVEFDVAVAVESANGKQGGAGIRVLEILQVDGKVSSETKNSVVSRVKFSVAVHSKTKDEERGVAAETEARIARNRASRNSVR